ncbi:MAG: lysophospholipid acyltransferase family protein, partial [Bacteroidota bacterium]|nr:lysophospholipid acyltransferase family protein [Bacteroidota bacterium]
MLYTLLRFLMRITVSIFFRSITIRNKGAFPEKGPLLVLANHPSTFMDPIVIATLLQRKVFFLAKGELFKSAFAKWLLPKFNMIPVYRKQDDPTQMNKNQDTFNKCFEHLESGGVILMFPEGISITERKLRPIKTGAARIAIGAEARNDFKLGVKVVNVGLNYADPHHFNRDLFINIHEAIEVKDYKEEYAKDNFKASEILTEDIRTQLETLVIAIEDEQMDELVKDIEVLYTYKISKENDELNNKAGEFAITKNIIETVQYYMKHDKERVERIRSRIKNYFTDLGIAGLHD